MEGISFIDAEEQAKEETGLSWQTSSLGLSPTAASIKAEMTGIALGPDSPPQQDLAAYYSWSSDDDVWRQKLALSEAEKNRQAQDDVLRGMIDQVSASPDKFDMSVVADNYASVSSVDPFAIGYDPAVNLEMKFGENFNNFISSVLDLETYQQNLETEEGLEDFDVNSGELAFVRTIQELSAEVAAADAGFSLNDVYEFGTSMIPFVQRMRIMNEVEDAPSSSWNPGTNYLEQYLYLMSLPASDRIIAVRNHVAKLREEGLFDEAGKFLVTMSQGYSLHDAAQDNAIQNSFDALELTPIGLLGDTTRLGRAVGKKVVKGMAATPPKESVLKEVAQHSGDVVSASSVKLANYFEGVAGGIDDIADKAVGVFNPHRYIRGTDTAANAHYAKLSDEIAKGSDAATEIFDSVRIARQNPIEYREAVNRTTTQLVQRFSGKVTNNVVDVEEKFIPATNTTRIGVSFGHVNGQLFETQKKATRFAKERIAPRTDDFEVVPYADKWVVRVYTDLDETSTNFGKFKLESRDEVNDSFANRFIAAIRSPGYVLSESNMQARKTALHGEQRLNTIFSDLVEPFKRMRNSERDEVLKMLELQRDLPNPKKKNDRGFYYQNAQEFEAAFLSTHGKLPTEAQHKANWAYREAMDIDFLMRATGRYRDINRVGGKNVAFTFKDKKGKTNTVSGLGRQVDNIDFTKDGVIKLIDRSGKVSGRHITPEDFEKIKAKGNIEVFETIETPFKFGDNSIAHVVIVENGAKVNRVKFSDLLNYNPGGHVQHKFPIYIKQAKLAGSEGKKYFMGDQTILNATSEKGAARLADLYNKIRVSIKEGTDDWRRIVDDELTHTTKDEVWEAFKGKNAYLDIDTPIQAVRAGSRTIDTIAATGVRVADSPYNQLADLERKFTQERGMNYTTLAEEESGKFKILGTSDALLDPLETLQVATRNSVNARAQKDYVVRSVKDILNNFSDIIRPEVLRRAESNPMEFLYNEKAFLDGADKSLVSFANVARKAALRQVAQVDTTHNIIEAFRHRLTELAYPGLEWKDVGGKAKIARAALPFVKDPISFAKNVAFDLKLGMFNPVQIFVQAQTMAYTLGHADNLDEAWRVVASSASMQMHLFNKEEGIWKHFGRAVNKAGGFTSEEYVESLRALERSGWHLVGRDLGYLDDVSNHQLFESGGRRFLDAGRVFFNGVERTLRLNGWNLAYSKWKKLNPGKKVDDQAISWIIDKADDYTVNMSAANNAVWQKGVFGAVTQFASYQIRLMEQMLPALFGQSKRMSTGRAWFLFGVMSSMYGVGYGGVSAAVGGLWPMGESIRQYALQNGYDLNDTYFEFLQDGIPSVLTEMMTGYDLDFSSRYAPGGYSLFKDLFDPNSDVHPAEIIGGAPGSILSDVISGMLDTSVVAYYAASDLEDTKSVFKVTGSSLNEVLNNISSYKLGNDVYAAWNMGKWLMRNGSDIADVDKVEGTIARILGATPQDITDAYLKGRVMKLEGEAKTKLLRQARNEYRKALRDEENGVLNSPHYETAKAWLIGAGYSTREAEILLAEELRNTPYLNKIEERWQKREVK